MYFALFLNEKQNQRNRACRCPSSTSYAKNSPRGTAPRICVSVARSNHHIDAPLSCPQRESFPVSNARGDKETKRLILAIKQSNQTVSRRTAIRERHNKSEDKPCQCRSQRRCPTGIRLRDPS